MIVNRFKNKMMQHTWLQCITPLDPGPALELPAVCMPDLWLACRSVQHADALEYRPDRESHRSGRCRR